MLINKTSVRKIYTNFPYLEKGNKIYFGVASNLVSDADQIKAGFTVPLQIGDKILPSAIGSITRFNADGKEVLDKTLPKENRIVNTVEWHWTLWDGTEQSRWVDVTRDCWQRKILPPPSMEIQVVKAGDGSTLIVSPEYTVGNDNEAELTHAVNTLLELFGSCVAYSSELEGILPTPTRRLNWTILPKGEHPWEKLQPKLHSIIQLAPIGNRLFIEKRLQEISRKKPSFCAIGHAGFSGYVIFGVSNALFVCESIHYGNATYMFGSNWEQLSKMTKADIVSGKLAKYRIVHNASWYKSLNDIFDKEKI